MSTAATSSPDRNAAEAYRTGLAPASGAIAPEVASRRVRQRRQMLILQAVSYSFGASVLLLYAYAGTISIGIPSLYWLSGVAVIGIFAVLSETNFSDRFVDHYLTVFQVTAHVGLQLAFLWMAPTVGFAFISTLFLIFALGALRMTSRQAMTMWGLAIAGLVPVFLFSDLPICMPVTTPLERLAALLCFVLVIGQCAFVGLFGSTLRETIYRRSVELRAAYQRIEELAELDELTGSFNRRRIMRLLDEEVERARKSREPCSVALIDLDWFKRINDVYGHPTGDEVLRTFAITAFANIRAIDRFGRYGGEEFLLVLPGCMKEEARRILDRMRSIIADVDWSAFSPGMRITISAGIATLRKGDTTDSILARADEALYAAKAQGRNRVASA